MRRTSAALIVALISFAPAVAAEADAKVVRKALDKALPLIAKGAEGHIKQRSCFACHNQAIAMLAFVTARDRGFTVRAEDLQTQMKFIVKFLDTNRANYLKGKGQGGQVDMAGYALLTLEWGGWKADATTDAVVEYMLQRNEDLGRWKPVSNRPPSEASDFTANYLALRALKKWGKGAQKERIDRRIESAAAWLLKTRPKDTEDRVFRLRALKEVGAEQDVIREAIQDLVKTQREDGGWGQLDKLDSDAYATGSVLVALHEVGGMAVSDPVYQKGVAFLLKSQLPDGSWLVRSRSRPFQTYYESGFPHEKNQFISMAASSWAATALALTLPAVDRQSRRHQPDAQARE